MVYIVRVVDKHVLGLKKEALDCIGWLLDFSSLKSG